MSNANVGKVFNMTSGNSDGSALELETLAIIEQPDKTIYKSGESFDPTGMVVTTDYGCSLTSNATGYTVSPQVLTDGVTKVTITYTEGRVTKTAGVPVTVKRVLVSIAITANPTKTTYQYLETFDPAGMAVTVTYSDEPSKEVSGYTHSPGAFPAPGQQAVRIQYAYEGVARTASLTVTVNPIEVTVPVQNGVLTYDGETKMPAWTRYDTERMTISGETNDISAGTYSAKFILDYGCVFPGGQNEATVSWVIGRAVIVSPPEQNNALAANRKSQSPIWDSYDTSKLTTGGGRFGTEARDYTATFASAPNYKQWDGSIGAEEVTWTTTSVIAPIPVQKGSPTYAGALQTPEWDNFDQEGSSVSVTP